MKKTIAAVLLLAVSMQTSNTFAAAPPRLTADSQNYSADSYVIRENRVYCSIETLSSMMGALNAWVFKDERSASFITHFSAQGDSDEFYTWFGGSNKVEIRSKIDGQEKVKSLTMNHPTLVAKNGEILIPLRDALSVLGKQIAWDRETGKITVTGRIAY